MALTQCHCLVMDVGGEDDGYAMHPVHFLKGSKDNVLVVFIHICRGFIAKQDIGLYGKGPG